MADFDAVHFLEGLFSESSATAFKPVQGDTTHGGDPTPAGDQFAGWVRRQDATGRWGWEAPDLPEWQRWWARCQFEDLPEPSGPPEPADQRRKRCHWPARCQWWRSVHGEVVCGWCHSPAVPELAVEWLNDSRPASGPIPVRSSAQLPAGEITGRKKRCSG